MKKIVFKFLIIANLFACNTSDDKNVNDINCCDSDSLVIEVNNIGENTGLEFYDVFTPNGDGFNDNFVIGGLAQYSNYTLKIFSGSVLVLESNDYAIQPSFGNNLINDDFTKKVFTYELLIDQGNSFKATGVICAIKSSGNQIDNCNLFDFNDPLFD